MLILTAVSGASAGEKPGGNDSQSQPPATQSDSFAAEHAKKFAHGLDVFRKDVRGILDAHCVTCHGKDAVKSELNLTTREGLLRGGTSGPVLVLDEKHRVVFDRAKQSRLYRLISHAQKPHMPYQKDKLSDQEIARIAEWIDHGAPYDKPLVASAAESVDWTEKRVPATDRDYWAFQPLKHVDPPDAAGDWCRTPIDRFILAKLNEKGLTPSGPASRRQLIRRAYFDLIGLPPTPDEVDAFINDPAPDVYERLVDRLLDSPHYGERWARHWMDVARFAESHGYEQDYNRDHAYPYRDFLIRAFNEDMPYDRFIRWQLAGDELAPQNPWALTATGFLGAAPFPTQLTEAEFESARYEEMDDMLRTTGTAVLGLTVGCARCHDHKFDPIPSADYYRLLSTFTTAIRSEIELTLDGEKTTVMVTSEGFPHMKHHADDRGFPHFYEKTYFLKRGDVNQKQGVAQQGFLQVLMRDDTKPSHWHVEPPHDWTRTSFRRANFANWITDTEEGAGHLAARVIVNRLWHYHFGRGIVATPNDFGHQGQRPTHPELLDWLAGELIRHHWRLKPIHQLILTSAVYRQDSRLDEANANVDPQNVYLWRWQPRRLEAEPIRDSMLAVSGLLDQRMYGPGTLDQTMPRRSVYFFIKRSDLIPMMMLFDWPEHLVSIGRRASTTTAPQALLFMNSPEARQFAEGLAHRIASVRDADDQIERAYRLAFGRLPSDEERQLSIRFLESQTASYQHAGRENAESLALIDFCQALLSMNELVYVD